MTDDILKVELTTFSCKEAYVYSIPSASTIGHRAELWNPDKPLQDVSVAVVTASEECTIRLTDCKSGAPFAECPVSSSAPLTTSVEPVIDSSRYFVLRVVDPQSQRHAFIGFGFRERSQASDFNAALHDHLQYLSRKREAERRAAQYAAASSSSADSQGGGAPADAAAGVLADLSLKPGETLKLKLVKPRNATGEGGTAAAPPAMHGARLGNPIDLFGALSAPKAAGAQNPTTAAAGGAEGSRGLLPLTNPLQTAKAASDVSTSAGAVASDAPTTSGGQQAAAPDQASKRPMRVTGQLESDASSSLQSQPESSTSSSQVVHATAAEEGSAAGDAGASLPVGNSSVRREQLESQGDDEFGGFEG